MASSGHVGPIMTPGGVGNVCAIEQPVAATQYVYKTGSKFGYFDSSGYFTMNLTLTEIVGGWLIAPVTLEEGTTAAAYWTSSSTAGKSKVPIIMAAIDQGCVYRVPCTSGSGLSVAARRGETVDLVGVNDGTMQYTTPGTNTQDILIFMDIDPWGNTDNCLVTVNTNEMQMDT